MKRKTALVMATLMLVFSLTACGGNSSQQGSGSQDSSTQSGTSQDSNAQGGTSQSGGSMIGGESGANTGNSQGGQSGTSGGESQSSIGEGLDDIRNGVDNAMDDITGAGNSGGVSYEQMLRNGKVHDRDGNLNDHENASTPGAF